MIKIPGAGRASGTTKGAFSEQNNICSLALACQPAALRGYFTTMAQY